MRQIVTICGKSLSGKTTLARLLGEMGGAEMVSHTTRPMRAGEVDGKDYHYVTRERFDATDMAESVMVHGNSYGLAVETVNVALSSDKVPLVVVEPQGCAQLSQVATELGWTHTKIWIEQPTSVLAGRMAERIARDDPKMRSSHESRWEAMEVVESGWAKAISWDIHISNFNANTQDSALQLIFQSVPSLES
tara:strand:+ start:2007 stop:2582 length:576 start_codon:yes stop_codon:yes gene_type:complete